MSERMAPESESPDPADPSTGVFQPAPGLDAPVTPVDQARPPVAKAADIVSVRDLVDFAYAQEGKRFSIPKGVMELLAQEESRSNLDDPDSITARRQDDIEHARTLAAADRLFAVPPRLLVEIENANPDGQLRQHLSSVVMAVVESHPAFAASEAFRRAVSSPAVDPDDAFRSVTIAVRRLAEEPPHEGGPQLSDAEKDRLEGNVITALALFLAFRHGWSKEDFSHRMYHWVWRPAIAKPPIRRPRSLLADARATAALGVVAEIFESRSRRAERDAAEEADRATQANRRAFAAEEVVELRDTELAEAAESIRELQEQVRGLEEAMETERRSRIVDKSHHVDDFEALRTRILRMLDRQMDLLSDGLHALRNGSTAVTEEYLERSLDAFSKELHTLRDERGGGT
jgi:hypothetical protein